MVTRWSQVEINGWIHHVKATVYRQSSAVISIHIVRLQLTSQILRYEKVDFAKALPL